MTVDDAKNQWTEAASASKAKAAVVRDGNWQPIARALRHCREGSTIEPAGELNGDKVLQVTPAQPSIVAPFLLVVK